MTTIQAGLTYYKQVNEKVREAAEKDDNITIENVIGQRYIGCGSSGKTITVYGTPAEESISGKVVMLENGCTFEELDVALMMHGGPATQVDVKSLALNKLKIIYHGVCSHAALKPEKGRSALDGLILACQGVEFLREHVPSDVRMHYTIVNCGGTAANVVSGYAEASMPVDQ